MSNIEDEDKVLIENSPFGTIRNSTVRNLIGQAGAAAAALGFAQQNQVTEYSGIAFGVISLVLTIWASYQKHAKLKEAATADPRAIVVK